jgi:hypothetical protein
MEDFVSKYEQSECQRAQDKRFMTLCHRLGIMEDGRPTGNGLLRRIEELEKWREAMRPMKIAGRIVTASTVAGGLWAMIIALIKHAVSEARW